MIVEIEKAHIECAEVGQNGTLRQVRRGTLGAWLRQHAGQLPCAVCCSVLPARRGGDHPCTIEGVQHEFSTVPGVKEDVTELILNLKALVGKAVLPTDPRPSPSTLKGPCEVKAEDIHGGRRSGDSSIPSCTSPR